MFGIFTGAFVDIAWLSYMADTKVYEIIPGFFAGLVVAVLVSLLTAKPSEEVEALFDRAVKAAEE